MGNEHSQKTTYKLTGSWKGRYFYAGDTVGNTFEAIFTEQGEVIEGSILDDPQLGEATINGTFRYPTLTFTKHYYKTALPQVEYSGNMDEEGTTIQGLWFIQTSQPEIHTNHGTWIATRDPGSMDFSIKDKNTELTRQANPNTSAKGLKHV